MTTTTSRADAKAGVRHTVTAYERLCRKVEEMIVETRGGMLPIVIELREHDLDVVDRVMETYTVYDWSCNKVPNRFGGFSLQMT